MQTDTMTEATHTEPQAEPQATPQAALQAINLEATVEGASETTEAASDVANGQSRSHTRGSKGAKPQQGQPVNHVLEKLFELYPKLFGAHFLPLKLGVFHDLMARHPDDFKKDELKLAMGKHARSTRYLDGVAAGLARHDLDGNAVEPVSPEHIHHAILEVFRRRQARSREDLRPRLRVLLMQAVEASGLSREDYVERVRVQDDATNALLDDAMAALGMEAAKREALARAFEASGKTEAEFADMYGMNPAQVAEVVKRVRHERSLAATASTEPVEAE